jgi:hypothetical protein
MATMKAEFLSHYQAQHGIPLRSRLFGAIRRLNRLGRRPRPVCNLPLPRALLERATGIDPPPAAPALHARHAAAVGPGPLAAAGSRGDVVFLADSFTTFTEPRSAAPAIELLELAGWNVRLESAGCCGRSSISKGLLGQARGMAEAMVERLAPEAERGVPIVGCEPSCLLTLREEHPGLLPGDPRARAVADATRLVRSCWSRRSTTARWRCARSRRGRPPDPLPRPLPPEGAGRHRRHGRAARAHPRRRVTELDAGCCGMAGSFGFEAEHYDLSMQIGEQRLFPALARRRARHAGGGHRRVVPAADRPRRGAARLASCRAREELRVIRWGIISTGGIASTFASELAHTDSGIAVAVGSRRAASAEAFGERFGIPNRHDSYEALVEDPEVDAVYVGTPHPMHHEDALLALRAASTCWSRSRSR